MSSISRANEVELRAAIVAAGRILYDSGLIAGGDGNISVRLDPQRLLITPAGLSKGRLSPEDLVIVDLEGNLLEAVPGRRQSTEQRLHLHVYRRRPEAQAVVHAHPPTAVAATLAGVDLTAPLLPEAILALGPVPTAPYALTGTSEMADAIDALIADHDVLMLSHHGALTLGKSLDHALMAMEQIEHCAKILLAAHLFGGARTLPAERIAELHALRARIKA